MDYSPKKFQEQFEKYGFNLKKIYGQNFIIDENVINSIIEKAQIDKDTLVIEMGIPLLIWVTLMNPLKLLSHLNALFVSNVCTKVSEICNFVFK